MQKTRRSTAFVDGAALVVLCAETALVAVIAVGYVAYALLERSFSGLGLSLAAVAAVLASGLAVVTYGFARRRRYALGGAMTWQLMQSSVGVWVVGERPLLGIVLLASAAVVVVAVLTRQARLAPRSPDQSSP